MYFSQDQNGVYADSNLETAIRVTLNILDCKFFKDGEYALKVKVLLNKRETEGVVFSRKSFSPGRHVVYLATQLEPVAKSNTVHLHRLKHVIV